MDKPNLFDFATSELSQDAFLAWLIQYADSRYADDTTGVCQAARRFLDYAFKWNSRQELVGELKITVKRQHRHIDVYATIEEISSHRKYVLIVEDKAGTTEHDNQLVRYQEVVHEEGYDDSQLICVYCQTHNECEKKAITDAGYARMNRQNLLEILNVHSNNLILLSFVGYLNHLEKLTNGWKIVEPRDCNGKDKWSWHAWQGFFMEIRRKLGEGTWAYVPNPSGGFLGFWWHWCSIDGGSLYLQLEEGKACFKVEVDKDVDAGAMKWVWNAHVIAKAAELGVDVIKPSVMRKGSWMTVAVLKNDYREIGPDGLIDVEKTMRVLKEMMTVADSVSHDWYSCSESVCL